MKIRIATRKSPLALAQTRWVAARIREHRPDVEIAEVAVSTKGDRVLDKPLASIGGKALFVSEVEATLLRGEADLAVHSMKDVPTDENLAEGYDILCVPEREDPRDGTPARPAPGPFGPGREPVRCARCGSPDVDVSVPAWCPMNGDGPCEPDSEADPLAHHCNACGGEDVAEPDASGEHPIRVGR